MKPSNEQIKERCLLTPEEMAPILKNHPFNIFSKMLEAQHEKTRKEVEDEFNAKVAPPEVLEETIEARCQIARKEVAEEIYEEIICHMCYRLNPQHATMDNGIGCKSCEEKEYWCNHSGKDGGK